MNLNGRKRCAHWLVIACCVLAWSASFLCAPAALATRAIDRPLRVLLIGNSYTQALPQLLRRLSETGQGRAPLHVESVAHGGFTLRDHLGQGEAASRIRRGRYDMVVLQGHSLAPLNDPFELDQSVRLFDRMIQRSGAQTVLYATWARQPGANFYRTHWQVRSFDQMAKVVHVAYSRLAGRLNTRLAPVGRAFARAVVSAPSLALYQPDGSHSTPTGALLAACVLYGTLTGQDPRATSYRPTSVSVRDATLVRKIAAQALRPARNPSRSTLARASEVRRTRNESHRTARP